MKVHDMNEALARLKPYSGKLVTVQLKTPFCMLSYAGSHMLNGKEVHGLMPAQIKGPNGEAEPVGFSPIIPSAILDVNEFDVLLRLRDPATGAELHISLPADEVLYVTIVGKAPSKLVL
jgi:hypothetical protein